MTAISSCRFLPYLPPAGGADPALDEQTASAQAAINDDLEWLLAAGAGQLWGAVGGDGSLAVLVDTYLQHAPRPFDDGYQQRMTPLEVATWQRVLALLHRL